MMRLLRTFLLWMGITFYAAAQNEYTSYDNQHFRVGDQLELGYNYITSSKYVHLKEKTINQYNRTLYADLEVANFPFSTVTITRIIQPDKPEVFPNTNTVFALKSAFDPEREIFVEIDRALERGEIITKRIEAPLYTTGQELTSEILFACCVEMNSIPVTDEVILNFIGAVDPELGKICRSDAFTFQRLKPEYSQQLRKCMDELDFDQLYHIKVRSYHSNYNFDNQSYPLSFNQPENNTNRYFIPFMGFNLMPVNLEKYKTVYVPFLQTEQSEKRRKGTGRYASLNSFFYSVLYLNLVEEKMEIPGVKESWVNLEGLYRNTLVGVEIKGMEVYDHPGYKYNLVGTVR